MDETLAPIQPRRAAGRPRRITLDAIIDAACELGIDTFEMTAVAERLGIGVATLYGYVQHRDHLVRLAATRLSRRERIADRGQSWQDVIREHAAAIFEVYGASPQLVGQTMTGTVGAHVEIAPMEGLLALLIDRGLEPKHAMNLVYEVNQIVIGAAVGLAYRRSLEARAGSYGGVVNGVLADHGPEDLPALRRCLQENPDPEVIGDYRPTLERVLAAHETQMAAQRAPNT
jgi:hypothetical protein